MYSVCYHGKNILHSSSKEQIIVAAFEYGMKWGVDPARVEIRDNGYVIAHPLCRVVIGPYA